MDHLEAFLEHTWDGILSCDAQKVASVYTALSVENQKVVLKHLQKMAHEPGWHPEQVRSASFALDVINSLEKK
jgi:hypothetical protein